MGPGGARLTRFALVGGMAFLIDAGLLTLLVSALGFGHFSGRAISFGVAVSASWVANRKWVFHRYATANRKKEYLRYLAVQGAGALINFGIYSMTIILIPELGRVPVIPLAIGASVAMLFNFIASNQLVFTEGR